MGSSILISETPTYMFSDQNASSTSPGEICRYTALLPRQTGSQESAGVAVPVGEQYMLAWNVYSLKLETSTRSLAARDKTSHGIGILRRLGFML